MSDYIDRQAAIDRINIQRAHLKPKKDFRDALGDTAYRVCIEMIERLPSAEVEPVKRGKWIAIGNTGLAHCKCGYITDRYSIYNYCPNCGAKMKPISASSENGREVEE